MRDRTHPPAMPRIPDKLILPLLAAVALVFLALGGGGVSAGEPPASASAPAIFEGPGGRTALRRWILRTDPGDRGRAQGWGRGSFSGRSVSVPDVVDPRDYKGRAG